MTDEIEYGLSTPEEILNTKIQTWIYFLVKNAARNSYVDFLNNIGITMEEYEAIKEKVETTLHCKLYV